MARQRRVTIPSGGSSISPPRALYININVVLVSSRSPTDLTRLSHLFFDGSPGSTTRWRVRVLYPGFPLPLKASRSFPHRDGGRKSDVITQDQLGKRPFGKIFFFKNFTRESTCITASVSESERPRELPKSRRQFSFFFFGL